MYECLLKHGVGYKTESSIEDIGACIKDMKQEKRALNELGNRLGEMNFDNLFDSIKNLNIKRCDNCINELCKKRISHGNAIGCLNHVTFEEAYGDDFDYLF